MIVTDKDFLLSANEARPIKPPETKISNFAEKNRSLPVETPFPGPWKNEVSAHSVEIMDNMSPFSPIITTSVMKGAQTCITAAAECVVGYWMKELPAEILYITATDGLAEKWSNKRLAALIKSIGFSGKLSAKTEDKKSRKTGDKTFSKIFPGGALDIASAQSPASLRSDSKRILIIDESDGAPRYLRTGEGKYDEVAEARTIAWGFRKKILYLSTPTTEEESLIWDKFKLGDQRYYFVPCPFCGEYQKLEFKNLKPEFDEEDGTLSGVKYECSHCKELISNYHKKQMFPRGEWRATAIPKEKNHRSYHVSSLYSPFGMLTWAELYQKYINAKNSDNVREAMRSFVNIYLGKPFKDLGARPDFKKLIEKRGDYMPRDIPYGVLYLTVSIDVQTGSATDPKNPPRLEMEILGLGSKYRSWQILHKVFYGETTDAYSGAWEQLNNWAEEGGFIFTRRDGMNFEPEVIFIDGGDGNNLSTMYQFASRWQNTFVCMGTRALTSDKRKGVDKAGPQDGKRYRHTQNQRSQGETFVSIYTRHYKDRIYSALKVERGEDEENAPGFCDFPKTTSDEYFMSLIAEDKHADGSYHSKGRRNEGLDLRVYALCAGDMFLDSQMHILRANMKAAGYPDFQISNVKYKTILDRLEKETARLM